MLELYTYDTSNAQRVRIMLEECGLPFRLHRVDLMNGEQRAPDFLALNPVGAIPVLRDTEGPGGVPLTLSQSGAIMLYLAERTGRFVPQDPARRAEALQWFTFGITDCMLATAMIFHNTTLLPDKSEANVAYFEDRLVRYAKVVDDRLAQREWLAGELSIADFAVFPIFNMRRPLLASRASLKQLEAWLERLAARPAVARALA
jgi:GST-like protein